MVEKETIIQHKIPIWIMVHLSTGVFENSATGFGSSLLHYRRKIPFFWIFIWKVKSFQRKCTQFNCTHIDYCWCLIVHAFEICNMDRTMHVQYMYNVTMTVRPLKVLSHHSQIQYPNTWHNIASGITKRRTSSARTWNFQANKLQNDTKQ